MYPSLLIQSYFFIGFINPWGTLPTLSAWVTLAPCSISIFTISQCPFWQAMKRGDAPCYSGQYIEMMIVTHCNFNIMHVYFVLHLYLETIPFDRYGHLLVQLEADSWQLWHVHSCLQCREQSDHPAHAKILSSILQKNFLEHNGTGPSMYPSHRGLILSHVGGNKSRSVD